MPSVEDQRKEIADAIAELRSIPQLEAEREKVTELINEAEEQGIIQETGGKYSTRANGVWPCIW